MLEHIPSDAVNDWEAELAFRQVLAKALVVLVLLVEGGSTANVERSNTCSNRYMREGRREGERERGWGREQAHKHAHMYTHAHTCTRTSFDCKLA